MTVSFLEPAARVRVFKVLVLLILSLIYRPPPTQDIKLEYLKCIGKEGAEAETYADNRVAKDFK